MAGHVGKLASSTDPEYETRMRLAIDGLAEGTYRTISAAAKAQKVARQTLSDRHGNPSPPSRFTCTCLRNHWQVARMGLFLMGKILVSKEWEAEVPSSPICAPMEVGSGDEVLDEDSEYHLSDSDGGTLSTMGEENGEDEQWDGLGSEEGAGDPISVATPCIQENPSGVQDQPCSHPCGPRSQSHDVGAASSRPIT
ncbi:hypothetical protein EDD16DRAFT_1730380 [Pisolithus croceorrhizus]|nr:hypothetical protein EDD16DRAFT_1730380 [Pisolithus croceorrhizus]